MVQKISRASPHLGPLSCTYRSVCVLRWYYSPSAEKLVLEIVIIKESQCCLQCFIANAFNSKHIVFSLTLWCLGSPYSSYMTIINIPRGQMLWNSGLHIWYKPHTLCQSTLAQGPSLILHLLPANSHHGKQQMMTQILALLSPIWEAWVNFPAPGFGPALAFCEHLRSKQKMENPLFQHSAFQVNKNKSQESTNIMKPEIEA